VAVDVAGTEGGRLNESVVLVQGIPTSSLLPLVCGHVVPVGLGASREPATGLNTGDEAVSRRSVEEGGDGAEQQSRCKHGEAKKKAKGSERPWWRASALDDTLDKARLLTYIL
jgi:hypothetical protein